MELSNKGQSPAFQEIAKAIGTRKKKIDETYEQLEKLVQKREEYYNSYSKQLDALE